MLLKVSMFGIILTPGSGILLTSLELSPEVTLVKNVNVTLSLKCYHLNPLKSFIKFYNLDHLHSFRSKVLI